MIHIFYKIKASPVHGIGLFSDQEIKAEQLIYTPSPLLDVDITQDEFDKLSAAEQREVKYYGYFNNKTKKWHVAFDAIRILNHASEKSSNVTQDDNMTMRAKRDIKKGEELFQDYSEIYPEGGEHFNRINKS